MDYISQNASDKVRLTAPVYSGPPGAGQTVHDIKEVAARLITLIEQIDSEHPASARRCEREKALAITHIQSATMFAVFAATAPQS